MTKILKHPITLLTLFWAVFWWPVISGDVLLYIRDLTFYTVPMKAYTMSRFWAGEFPFWTPFLSSGMPFFADPSHQVLYPLNFLYFLTPSVVHGISLQSVLHTLIGMLGMFWLGRVLGLQRWVAAWMATLFGICGYTVSVTDNINYVAGVAWVPIALAAFVKGLQTPKTRQRLRYSALAALCVALMVLAGDTFHPMGLGIFCVLAIVLRKQFSENNAELISLSSACIHTGIMYGLAALICSAQIIPTLELLKLSARNQALSFEEVTIWSFPPMRIIEIIQPFFYGSKYPNPHFIGQFMYPAFREPWADSVYMGMIAVLFAASGLLCCGRKTWFWLLVFLAGLVLSMGYFWGESAFRILMDVFPPITRQRYLEKFIFWVHLALCVMAGLGAGYLLKHPETLWKHIEQRSGLNKVFLSLGLLLGSMLFLVHIPSQLWIATHAMERSIEWGTHFYDRNAHITNLYWHWGLVMAVLLGVLWQRKDTFKKYLVFLMIAALADLGWAHYNHVPTGKAQLLANSDTPAAMVIIEADQKALGVENTPARIFYDDLTDFTEKRNQPDVLAKIRDAYNLPFLNDSYYYHWLFRTLYNQQRLLFNYAVRYNTGYHNGRFAPLQPNSHKLYDNILVDQDAPFFAALSGIDYIITPLIPEHLIWDNPSSIRTVGIDRRYNLRVLAPVYKTPRIYLSPNAIYNPNVENVYKIVTTDFKVPGQENRYRLQTELAQKPPAHYSKPNTLHPLQTDSIDLVLDKPEHKTIVIHSPYEEAHLVFLESWFPGWQATVDDKPTEIILANHRFMAVAVNKGKHTIQLKYKCNNFLTGVLLSLLGLGICAGLLWKQKTR